MTTMTATAEPYAGWDPFVTHLDGMPCQMQAGDRVGTSLEVTCPACLSWMPQVPGRCDHDRIALMGRCHNAGVFMDGWYEWQCPTCGHKASRALDRTPARWWGRSDNVERRVRADEQVAARKADR